MKTRTILFLILSLAILSVLYYFDRLELVERRAAEVEKTRLLPFPPEQADSITVENRFGRFELARREDGWWIVDPVTEPAHQEMVRGVLLAALSASSKFGAVPITKEERGQYGLEQGAIRLRIVASSERKSAELILGGATPITGEDYLADAAQPLQVFVTPSNLRRAFDRPLLDVRDKRALRFFDISEVAGIAATWEDNRLIFDKQGARDWTVQDASDTDARRADARRVHDLLNLIEKSQPLSAEEEAKLPPAVVRRAFEESDTEKESRHEILLRTSREDAARVALSDTSLDRARLRFHPRLDDLSSTLALAIPPEKQWVFTVDDRRLFFAPAPGLSASLQKPAREFYDRNVFSLDADEVCYLQIEWKIGPASSILSLEREKNGPWRLTARPDTRLNQDSVALYVNYCLGQMMEPEPISSATPQDAGLEEPLIRVRLADAARSRREGFELGNPLPEKSTLYYARRVGDLAKSPDQIFAIRLVPSLAAFIKSESDFAERPAVLFEPENVHRVVAYFRAENETTSVTLTRAESDAGGWSGSIGGREPRTLPGAIVETFLLTLRGIEYVTEAQTVTDAVLAEYGLHLPSLSLHLYDRSGNEQNALYLGPNIEEKRETTLIRNGQGRFYFVPVEALGNMGQALRGVLMRIQ